MNKPPPAPVQVTCPTCNKPASWTNNPQRPFCSERCKLIDLGAWASGEHAIPGDSIMDAMSTPEANDDWSE